MINQTANLMYMMAKSGQIDSSYSTDFKKLQKHAFLISALCTCLYNIAVVSGSVAIRSTGDIRELCNGVLDRYEYELNKTIKERGRELLRQWN